MRLVLFSFRLALAIAVAFSSTTFAGAPFFDDFEDGNYMDNSPVTWSRYPAPYDLGTVAITDGNLVVTPSTDYPRYPDEGNYFETDLVVEDRLFHDVNVLTRFRASRSGSVTGFGLLDTYYTDALEGAALWGFLNHPTLKAKT